MDIESLKRQGELLKAKLQEKGYYKKPGIYSPNLIENNITFSLAYPIKAFEKFLGYYDDNWHVANNPSMSLRTDFSYCLSACKYVKMDNSDSVIVDGEFRKSYMDKAKHALDLFRDKYGVSGSFQFFIRRFRRYENSKGLSESSAVAASVSKSLLSNVFGKHASEDEAFVSQWARLVSGSGTRSSVSGLSLWLSYPGQDPDESFAVKVADNPKNMHYGIFPKYSDVRTDSAHKIAQNSIFYEKWVADKFHVINDLIDADFDTEAILKRGQTDTLNLNAILLSGGLILQTTESMELLRKIMKFQSMYEGIYFNADTGPSIMISSMDKTLIKEFTDTVDDKFLEGSFNFPEHTENLRDFAIESGEYFDSLKVSR
jgi:mevalonate pyrophosphate decarboxylase